MERISADQRGLTSPGEVPAGFHTAVILAGGRGSRLGGALKASLRCDGSPLLTRTLAAAGVHLPGAHVAVVGPPELAPLLNLERGLPSGIAGVRLTREEPAFSGPLSALAAGVSALREASGELQPRGRTAVLAVDYVYPARILAALTARELGSNEAIVPHDATGRAQPLASIWRTGALEARIAALKAEGTLENAPVRLLSERAGTVVVSSVFEDPTLFADIDVWQDAVVHGVSRA